MGTLFECGANKNELVSSLIERCIIVPTLRKRFHQIYNTDTLIKLSDAFKALFAFGLQFFFGVSADGTKALGQQDLARIKGEEGEVSDGYRYPIFRFWCGEI